MHQLVVALIFVAVVAISNVCLGYGLALRLRSGADKRPETVVRSKRPSRGE